MNDVTGIITDIQRFSIHDGPGIRTTVFLKGCSLHCFWCHNPETTRPKAEMQFLPEKCIACGACVSVCPQERHAIQDGVHLYCRDGCQACGRCADVCYTSALERIGRELTADQVVEELLRDRAFYQESRGGITLSGGEPLLQPDFAGAILRRCKEQRIHTAIETAGNYPWAFLAPLLPQVDLVMMDIKHMHPHKHRAGTGAANGRILANARKLAETDLPLIFRVPVVPGFNDGAGEMATIAAFVRQLVDSRSGDGRDGSDKAPFPAAPISLELLRFHPLAADKYRALGLANPTDGLQRPSDETIAELAEVAQMAGLEVKV